MTFNDSPIYRYGSPAPAASPVKVARYDGKPLPSFMLSQGYDSSEWQEFLRINRVSAFELEQGQEVILPTRTSVSSFPSHAEA